MNPVLQDSYTFHMYFPISVLYYTLRREHMLKKFLVLLLITALFACDNLGENNENQGSSNLTVGITDAPIDSADEVNVTFTKIEIAKGEDDDAEWITYFEGSQSINLLDFQNGAIFNFPQVELELGEYGQIRLFLSAEDGDNTIVIDEETHNLEYNAGVANTGLKLVGGFSLVNGVDTTLTIDFDARKSIVVKGGQNNPSYNLKPTIKLIQEDLTGNIIISNAEADTTYYIYDSETDVTDEESATDEDEETVPYLNATLSAMSYTEGEDTIVKFAYVPFGTYKVYKSSYNEEDEAQPLTQVLIAENETDTVTISSEDETEVTFTFE